MAHGNWSRKSKHAIPEEVKDQVAELYHTKYHGSENYHFAELLEERESLCRHRGCERHRRRCGFFGPSSAAKDTCWS